MESTLDSSQIKAKNKEEEPSFITQEKFIKEIFSTI